MNLQDIAAEMERQRRTEARRREAIRAAIAWADCLAALATGSYRVAFWCFLSASLTTCSVAVERVTGDAA